VPDVPRTVRVGPRDRGQDMISAHGSSLVTGKRGSLPAYADLDEWVATPRRNGSATRDDAAAAITKRDSGWAVQAGTHLIYESLVMAASPVLGCCLLDTTAS
jgi:hypothetical protein